MVATDRGFSFAGLGFGSTEVLGPGRSWTPARRVLATLVLLLPWVGTGGLRAEENSSTALPLPQLKSTLREAWAPPPPAVARPKMAKSSRRVPLTEDLPPVEPLPPVAVVPLLATQAQDPDDPFADLEETPPNPLPPGSAPRRGSGGAVIRKRDDIPLPLIRPNETTVPGGLRPLEQITVNIAPPQGALPEDRSTVLVVSTVNPLDFARSNSVVRYQWEPPAVLHGPLYFDDPKLEHFGQSCCPTLQPAISASKFLGNVLILPYRMALDPPWERMFNLRTWPRPGSPAPCVREHLPLRLKPLAVEAIAVLAIVFVIP
jgi:hypothetical protein